MKNILLARRYAKALFEFSIEKGVLEKVNNDMILVAQVMNENKELRTVIENSIIKCSKKECIMKEIFGSHVQQITLMFLIFLIRKGRKNQIHTIALAFRKMYLDYKNIVIVTITTAIAINKELEKKIAEHFSKERNKTIQIETRINPNIIGGFIVNLDDYQYDASIKNTIARLQTEFKENLFKKGF